jgi:hypothetical protein
MMKIRRVWILLFLEKLLERSLLLRRPLKNDSQVKQQIICDIAKIILRSRPRDSTLRQRGVVRGVHTLNDEISRPGIRRRQDDRCRDEQTE